MEWIVGEELEPFVLFIVIYMELGSDYYPPVGSITSAV